jgi:hypothetical protein
MASISPPSHTEPAPPVRIDTAPPWHQRAGTFLLRVLEQLGSQPSVWDPWSLLTPHRAVTRTVTRRYPRRQQRKPGGAHVGARPARSPNGRC